MKVRLMKKVLSTKTLTKVSGGSNLQSSKLPHVAQATKVSLEQGGSGNLSNVEATVVQEDENDEAGTEGKIKVTAAKVISVKECCQREQIGHINSTEHKQNFHKWWQFVSEFEQER